MIAGYLMGSTEDFGQKDTQRTDKDLFCDGINIIS